jgi:hypothetical protein
MQGRRENNRVVEAVSVEFQKYLSQGSRKRIIFYADGVLQEMRNVPSPLLEVPDVKVYLRPTLQHRWRASTATAVLSNAFCSADAADEFVCVNDPCFRLQVDNSEPFSLLFTYLFSWFFLRSFFCLQVCQTQFISSLQP